MRVFVLSTGRSGSLTFARSSDHARNYTAAHESRSHLYGDGRFEYPDDHIEVDNRLAWFLGSLHERCGWEARYVHLLRDEQATVESFVKRWTADPPAPSGTSPIARVRRRWRSRHPGASIVTSFAYSIILRGTPWSIEEREQIARFYVRTVNANIRHFLRDKPSMTVRLENAEDDFVAFWHWIGAQGDLETALGEWSTPHNQS